MPGTMTLDPAVAETAEREVLALARARESVPDLDRMRTMMPKANGDQDVW
ncbi:hypothetical protein ACRYCC_35065 [Actinomadura scrupuli]